MGKKRISNENVLFGILKGILNYPADKNYAIGVESMDDCALLRINDQESLAITSDFVRGSGFTVFQLGLMDYYDAGYYLISANLSDLASMGARPTGLTTVIRYGNMDDDDFTQVFQGMKASADVHQTPIVGGDIGGYSADVFVATAFGIVKTENALLRKNAKKGDLLCVTGVVGRAFTALLYFSKYKDQKKALLTEQDEQDILEAWRRPQARIHEGMLLANGLSTCCQDVSDGLKATVLQIAKGSGLGVTLFEEHIPIHPVTVKLARDMGIDPLEIACSASPDFELLFTIAPEREVECRGAFAQKGLNFSVIGGLNDSKENYLRRRDGSLCDVPGMPFDQRPIDEIIQSVLAKKKNI